MKYTKFILLFLSLFFAERGITQSFFQEIAVQIGIEKQEGSEGIAIGDFNNDGLEDIYVSSLEGENQLYKNQGNGIFVEMAASTGLAIPYRTKTSVWGDFNNDGWLDLYVGNQYAPDQLFLNKGDENFEEIAENANIYNFGLPQSVNLADVNGDGYLDIYVSNFEAENILYLNNQNNTFTDYTLASGALDNGKSMGSIFFDYDRDGDADLYLVHDDFEPNFLYQNDGKGHFTEVAEQVGVNTTSYGMGVDVGDVNNDGWLDIYITNLFQNILLLNNGDGTFKDVSKGAQIEDSGMGWGTSFLDFDNDGQLDIYVANDSKFSPGISNTLYHNLGDNTFQEVAVNEEVSNWGKSYGTACFDYNLDGRTDILVSNKEELGLQFFENQIERSNWVSFKLIGIESNRMAIGSKIELIDQTGKTHYKELTAGHGWTSQNSQLLHFGLGEIEQLEQIKIHWASGAVQ
ncbi:MAG: CRTAC1 family protein, partial [Bacteroidota bacterium]